MKFFRSILTFFKRLSPAYRRKVKRDALLDGIIAGGVNAVRLHMLRMACHFQKKYKRLPKRVLVGPEVAKLLYENFPEFRSQGLMGRLKLAGMEVIETVKLRQLEVRG